MSGNGESGGNPSPRVQLVLDFGAIVGNFRNIVRIAQPSRVISVLKADAYGLRVHHLAAALADNGSAGFGVATPSEALELLKYGKPVTLLSALLPDEIPSMISAGVDMPVVSPDAARAINDVAAKLKRKAKVHLKIDTGMGRLGMTPDEILDAAGDLLGLPWLDIDGICSHFPCADEPGNPLNISQIQNLTQLIDTLEARGFAFEKRHIAASGALFNLPASYRAPFNYVRIGLGLYGADKAMQTQDQTILPTVSLISKVVQIRRIAAGRPIGYSGTFIAAKPMRVAVVAAGYADGVPLALSNRGYVTIAGKKCPVVGRVSMDCMSVALDSVDVPVEPGDDAVLFSGVGNAMRIEDWAKLKGTHPYDILCSIGNRVARVAKMEPTEGIEPTT